MKKLIPIGLGLIILTIFFVGFFYYRNSFAPEDQEAQTPSIIVPEVGVKIAFIGDTGYGADFKAVLDLINTQDTDAVVHLGDFDYEYDPRGFDQKITATLGDDYPYVVVVGNHDLPVWRSNCNNGQNGCYVNYFAERYEKAGIALTKADLDSGTYSVNFKGIELALSEASTSDATDEQFEDLKATLDRSPSLWKICNWHKNRKNLQVGEKENGVALEYYDLCREMGAIIMNGHEHSYHRTKTLSSFEGGNKNIVNPQYPEPDKLKIYEGSTFVAVSGAGGKSIRNQDRCLPNTYPYGCDQEWASIYTSTQQAKSGALFITFNPEGDPRNAKGEFINVEGEIIDEFEIDNLLQLTNEISPVPSVVNPSATPTTTRTTTIPSSSPTIPTITMIPAPSNQPSVPLVTATTIYSENICGKADVDGDGKFSIIDFQRFGEAYGSGRKLCDDTTVDYGECGGRDWNRDGKLNIIDFGGSSGFAKRYSPKNCNL